MKLCILDSETVSKNDVSLDGITSLADTTVYGSTLPNEVAERIGDSDAVICNKCRITKEVFEACKNLKYVGLFATGYNNVDIDAATQHGAVVCNVPSYSTHSVAQHTFAFILDYFNRVSEYSKTVQNGDWVNYKLFSYFYLPIFEIKDMKIGIIGFGDIGKQVAKLSIAFGMKVLVYTRTPSKAEAFKRENNLVDEMKVCTFKELLKESDIVTLHCPLTEDTKELINKDTLRLMKKSALLINTSRGGVINEQDLADALNNGVIAHASVDVITDEPMREDCPLRGAKNITITPHIAWAPKQTRERLLDVVAKNLKAFIDGAPINKVN